MHPHYVRSNDLLHKSLPVTKQLLYQLSYRSIFNCEWIARIELAPFVWKTNILTVIRYPQVSERSACFLPLYIIIKEKHLLLSARFQRNRTSCDSRMHSAEQNQDLQSKAYIYACIDGTSRPYRSRTYTSSFVAKYSIRYTNGPVPTERIELPTSSL